MVTIDADTTLASGLRQDYLLACSTIYPRCLHLGPGTFDEHHRLTSRYTKRAGDSQVSETDNEIGEGESESLPKENLAIEPKSCILLLLCIPSIPSPSC
jgi:hypothetical protein